MSGRIWERNEMKYLEVLKLKKGILINFPQVSEEKRDEGEE